MKDGTPPAHDCPRMNAERHSVAAPTESAHYGAPNRRFRFSLQMRQLSASGHHVLPPICAHFTSPFHYCHYAVAIYYFRCFYAALLITEPLPLRQRMLMSKKRGEEAVRAARTPRDTAQAPFRTRAICCRVFDDSASVCLFHRYYASIPRRSLRESNRRHAPSSRWRAQRYAAKRCVCDGACAEEVRRFARKICDVFTPAPQRRYFSKITMFLFHPPCLRCHASRQDTPISSMATPERLLRNAFIRYEHVPMPDAPPLYAAFVPFDFRGAPFDGAPIYGAATRS